MKDQSCRDGHKFLANVPDTDGSWFPTLAIDRAFQKLQKVPDESCDHNTSGHRDVAVAACLWRLQKVRCTQTARFGVPDVDHNDIVQTLGWALQDPHMLPVNAIMAILCTLGLPNLLVPVFSWPTTSVLAMISSNVRLWIHTEEFGRGKCSEKAV